MKLGRRYVTLVVRDFSYWCKERTYVETSRVSLSQRYASLCNDRWSKYAALKSKQKIVGQQLHSALKGTHC